MSIGGQTSGSAQGSYVTTFDLQDKKNTVWAGKSGREATLPVT